MMICVDSINLYREDIDKYTEIVKGIEKESQQIGSSAKGDDTAGSRKTDERIFEAFARTFSH